MRTVNLRQRGNSLSVRLPKSVLTQAGISGLPTEFNVEVKNDEIILKKQKKPTSLKELFKDFDYKKYWSDWEKEHPNQSKELDTSGPVGRELF